LRHPHPNNSVAAGLPVPATREEPLTVIDQAERATGVQSVARAMHILRTMMRAEARGQSLRLLDIASATHLHKTTAHRLLRALEGENWITREPGSRNYRLGSELLSLATLATSQHRIRDLARPALARLADKTGDTVYLFARGGFDVTCIDRVEGSYPIRTLEIHVGDRRPLGVGAASLALLAALSEDEAEDVIEHLVGHRPDCTRLGAAWFRTEVARTRRDGYACIRNMAVKGMWGVGVPIHGPGGDPLAALSVASITERMQPARRQELAQLLHQEAERLAKALTAPLQTAKSPRKDRP
jgi:DNA-binding IclR family transcriptional regulator